jgi:hypothetical protein
LEDSLREDKRILELMEEKEEFWLNILKKFFTIINFFLDM